MMASKLLSRFGSKKDLSKKSLISETRRFKCVVRLFEDDEVIQQHFTSDHSGQDVLDWVFDQLNLIEKDYFGLRYVENGIRYWLDPTRLIVKQVKLPPPLNKSTTASSIQHQLYKKPQNQQDTLSRSINNPNDESFNDENDVEVVFCIRVKFYPANPAQVKDELTRYFLYQQVRRDLAHRRLYCLPPDAIFLMACVAQSELGDYDPNDHTGNYIKEQIKPIIPQQTEALEMQAMALHQSDAIRNQTPAEAELNFLLRAAQLETYGLDPVQVKDDKRNQLLLGVNHSGIIAFQGCMHKVHHIRWPDQQKITYEGKMFIVHYMQNGKKNLIGFKCKSTALCQQLWRNSLEQRYFFTMNSSLDIPTVITGGGLFSKQCKLRYSGRVERELLEDMKKISPNRKGNSNIFRRHSINANVPMTMRAIGRSNTAPLPNNESPDFTGKNSYLNYSTVSEPPHSTSQSANELPNSKLGTDGKTQVVLDKFDEEEWDASVNSSLPTEFDLRPDLTPTGDEKPQAISFETPVVRNSPSAISHHSSVTNDDSDETLEQVSEIVDQTPSTYQQAVKSGGGNSNRINAHNNHNAHTVNNKSAPVDPKKANFAKISCGKKLLAMLVTSILSALIILFILTCLLIVVLETDLLPVPLDQVRVLPEVVIFKRDYYLPAKESLLQSVESWLNTATEWSAQMLAGGDEDDLDDQNL